MFFLFFSLLRKISPPGSRCAAKTQAKRLPLFSPLTINTMQPSDKRVKLRKAAVARCRMFLKAYLPFLPGYPVRPNSASPGVLCWRRPDEDLTLTKETVRQAAFGWNELKKFSQAFPQAVDRAEAWCNAVPPTLEMLGRAIHSQQKLPDSLWNRDMGFSREAKRLAAALGRSSPGLVPLLDAVSWIFAFEPEAVSSILEGMERHQEEIVNILNNWSGPRGIDLGILLVQMEILDGSERWGPFFRMLGTENAKSVPVECVGYCDQWEKILRAIAQKTRIPKRFDAPQKPFTMEPPQRPVADWADPLFGFVQRIANIPAPGRREILEIFFDCLSADLFERWRLWWSEAHSVFESAGNLLNRVRDGIREDNVKRSEQAVRIAELLKQAGRQAPPSLPPSFKYRSVSLDEILAVFAEWGESPWKSHRKSLKSLLRSVEKERGALLTRLKSLLVFRRNYFYYQNEIENGSLNVSSILGEMKTWNVPAECLPKLLDLDWSVYCFMKMNELRAVGQAVRNWLVENKQNEDFEDVVEICRTSENPAKQERFLKAFAAPEHRNKYYGSRVIGMATRLAESDTEFGILLKHLDEIECEKSGFLDGDLTRIDELSKRLRDTPWNHCFVETLLERGSLRILDLADQVAFLRKREVDFKLPDFETSFSSPWIERYPDILKGILRQLDTLTANGEKTARKRLEPFVFESEEIRKEIVFLRQRLDGSPDHPARSRIEKRIANLSRRVEREEPPKLSDSRVKRLDAKLRARVRREFFERLRETVQPCFERTVCRELEIDSYPDSWREPLHRKIVLGILGLDAPKVKPLAIKLLRSLCGSARWDYQNEPANRLFLQNLRQQGIDTAPWTEPQEFRRHVVSKNETLILALEVNPLEILKMGAPFQTCLSPWSFNFFSTIANTLDVNKHVLYARDSRGSIRARCLVALTDSGELLAFHPYAHDPDLKFKELTADFLKRLAERMHTVVVDGGRVSKLVSPEWYDDGCVPISDHFTFLTGDSPFRKKLETISPSRLLDELEHELAPLPLRSYVFSPFLSLPLLEQRPELLLPLLPFVSHGLSFDERVKLVKFVQQAGAQKEAEILLRKYLLGDLDEFFGSRCWKWEETVSELAKLFPLVLLDHVRRLSPHGTKKIPEEQREARRRAMVLIYESLGRKRKVKRCLSPCQ